MTREQVREVLRRVQVDGDFLDRVVREPAEALAEYDLTDAEAQALTQRDERVYVLLASADDDEGDLDLDKLLEQFPDLTLPPLHPPKIPPGGGLQLSLPPLTLTLGRPAPPAPLPPPLDMHLPLPPPLPDPPPNPFPEVPTPPPSPPPDPPPLPDPPPTPPMHPKPPPVFSWTFHFLRGEGLGGRVPDELVTEVRDARGGAREAAIGRLLRVLDGRPQ